MTCVSLQMISLGSLLILSDCVRSSVGGSRCISEDELSIRTDKFRSRYWVKLSVAINVPSLLHMRTCAQTAGELHGDLNDRSLSPWRYSLDSDLNRYPHEIAFAECLCQGCIINQREELSYNSVPVYAPLMVLKKTLCPGDPDKYVVKRDIIAVPVACTCAVPKYHE